MKIISSNMGDFIRVTRSELNSMILKFEEAKRKKKTPGLGKGPCGRGQARGKGGKGGAGTGYGKGDGTGPRSKKGICPKTAQHLLNVVTLDKLDDRELSRALRDAIISEEEAIKQYEAIADSTDNSKIKSVLQEIADEEKVHVGELQTLLQTLSKNEESFLEKGEEEVNDH